MLRRFRYQHAYGVVILIGSLLKKLDYTAIWCEQHEDFLAEISDTLFDAYQIKTKKSELGPWKITDEAFEASINRFARLNNRFPSRIRRFNFVSNTEPFDTTDKTKEHQCPLKLVQAVKRVISLELLDGAAKKGFELLSSKASVAPQALFKVLKEFDFLVGPTIRAFEAELAQDHVGKLQQCASLSPSNLAKVREALIAQVAQASSLYSDDPGRHYSAIDADYRSDPLLIAKRISIEDALLTVTEATRTEFQYLPSLTSLRLGAGVGQMTTMKRKMDRGGLAYHYEVMRRRALSAEAVLLELATRPDHGIRALSQLENIVLAECDDALLRISGRKEPTGVEMLIDVQDRLTRIALEEPNRVYRQSPDVLIGTAGLLTSACKVWWGQPFQLEGMS